jgi:hypothetical protein
VPKAPPAKTAKKPKAGGAAGFEAAVAERVLSQPVESDGGPPLELRTEVEASAASFGAAFAAENPGTSYRGMVIAWQTAARALRGGLVKKSALTYTVEFADGPFPRLHRAELRVVGVG